MKKISAILLAVCAAGMLSAYETYAEAYKAGTAARTKRDYKSAYAAYEEALKLSKSPSAKNSAEFMMGVVLCEDKQYDKGIAQLREALNSAVNPHQKVSAQFHIAYYLGAQKKYEEAIAEMQKVKEIGKGLKNTYVDLADCRIGTYLVALKRYDEALAAVKDSLANKNSNVAYAALLASYDANKGLKNTEGMQAAVDGLLALKEPQPYMFFTARVRAFELARSQKKHEEALKYGEEIASKEGLNAYMHDHGVYYKAVSYASLGDKENAIAQWKLLENSSVKYFKKNAASNIKRLEKK